MRAVMQHGCIVAIRLQEATKQIAHDGIVVDDEDLWIHTEILVRQGCAAVEAFLTNTYSNSHAACARRAA
ncbi:hypothetical protein PTKU15_29750 [Paraburkholderia terrae]|nr:hypothetical protein PTKU15_29750 [Paraburkholderia terrae]